MLGWSMPTSPTVMPAPLTGLGRLAAVSGVAFGAATGAGKLGDGSEGNGLGGDAAGRSLCGRLICGASTTGAAEGCGAPAGGEGGLNFRACAVVPSTALRVSSSCFTAPRLGAF